MIKRIAIIPTANLRTVPPTLPVGAIGFVSLADMGTRTLVKLNLPDGTAKDATTIADITFDNDGRQLDIELTALTALQRTTIATMLTTAGLDGTIVDATITDRKKLAFALLHRLAGRVGMNLEDVLWAHDAT